MRAGLALFLMLLGAAAAGSVVLRSRNATSSRAAVFERFPEQIGGRRAVDLGPIEPGRVPIRLQESSSFQVRSYWDPSRGDLLELLLAYAPSHERATRMAAPQTVLPRSGWRVESQARWKAALPAGPAVVNEALISRGPDREVVAWWFLTRTGAITTPDEFHWALTRNALAGRPTDAALIRLALPVRDDDVEAARRELRAWCSMVLPGVAEAIPIVPPPNR